MAPGDPCCFACQADFPVAPLAHGSVPYMGQQIQLMSCGFVVNQQSHAIGNDQAISQQYGAPTFLVPPPYEVVQEPVQSPNTHQFHTQSSHEQADFSREEWPSTKPRKDTFAVNSGKDCVRVRGKEMCSTIEERLLAASSLQEKYGNGRKHSHHVTTMMKYNDVECYVNLEDLVDVRNRQATHLFQSDNAVDTSVEPTTMMIRNIPCRITLERVVDALDSVGFCSTYDFVHLPHRFAKSPNLGYAFVNFYNADDAARFAVAFNGFRFPRTQSNKKCEVTLADRQGFNAGTILKGGADCLVMRQQRT
jgi:hypothetical protein